MTNEVLECIKKRRSIRKFLPEQIKDEELNAILEAGTWAPSGGNNQTWLFTAIQNRSILRPLNKLVKEAMLTWEPDDNYPNKLKNKEKAKNDDYDFYFDAPTLVILSNVPGYQNAMADCALAAGNMFLAAASMGIGSCYINTLRWLRDIESVREFLFKEVGLEREQVICMAASFGYAGHQPEPPARKENTIRIIR